MSKEKEELAKAILYGDGSVEISEGMNIDNYITILEKELIFQKQIRENMIKENANQKFEEKE